MIDMVHLISSASAADFTKWYVWYNGSKQNKISNGQVQLVSNTHDASWGFQPLIIDETAFSITRYALLSMRNEEPSSQ